MFEKTEDSVRSKMNWLGFVGATQVDNNRDAAGSQLLSSTLVLSEGLPSVETVLKKLVAAGKPVDLML